MWSLYMGDFVIALGKGFITFFFLTNERKTFYEDILSPMLDSLFLNQMYQLVSDSPSGCLHNCESFSVLIESSSPESRPRPPGKCTGSAPEYVPTARKRIRAPLNRLNIME